MVFSVVLSVLAGQALGDPCAVTDTFNDGTHSGTWSFGWPSNSNMTIAETNGRARIGYGGGGSNLVVQSAGAWGEGWLVDLTQDWQAQMTWHVNVPIPVDGEAGLSFAMMTEGDPDQFYYGRAFTITALTETYWNGVDLVTTPLLSGHSWLYGVPTPHVVELRDWTTRTLYVWYWADSRTIAWNDAPTLVGAPSVLIGGITNGFATALIGFAGHKYGMVSGFSHDALTVDDFALYGSLAGPGMGSCVLDADCCQTIQASCEAMGGVFTHGEPCCGCPYDVNCDQSVGTSDVTTLLDAWGTDCTGCAADVDASGTVGVSDLLAVLEHWGGC